jgi:tRNA-specific 2-thiouridylase
VAKDQSYVVHMLDQAQLARTLFPVGGMQKADLRALAEAIDLRTASKPDSQDVCFITSTGGRTSFLADRIPLRAATVVDVAGNRLGEVESVELVTVGQRKGIGLPGGGPKRYVVDVDVASATVTVGTDADLLRGELVVDRMCWVDRAVDGPALVQCSAHGRALPATITRDDDSVVVRWDQPQRRVAPGQSVVVYTVDNRSVLGGGVCR